MIFLESEEAKKGFYPTPPELADKLLDGIKWDSVRFVLEPSAGAGNLGKEIRLPTMVIHRYEEEKKKYETLAAEMFADRDSMTAEESWQLEHKLHSIMRKPKKPEPRKVEIDCIEIDAGLREKLKARHFTVIHDDFLTFVSRKHYDLIAMNPPFHEGDKHLLKAIQLQEADGGQIRCLLNANTLKNPFSNTRKLLIQKLEELDADVSYEIGAFEQAERKTDVEVAIVKIAIPYKERESEIYSRLEKSQEYTVPGDDPTDLTSSNYIEQAIAHYNLEVDAGIALIREYHAMKPYMMTFHEPSAPTISLHITEIRAPDHNGYYDTVRSTGSQVNDYLRVVRLKYWEALFANPKFTGGFTSNLANKYRSMVADLRDYDFSEFNIREIAKQMTAEMNAGIQETIVELFDKLTQEHAWFPECQKNKHYFNGWATNKAHKIGMKVILPVNGMFASRDWIRLPNGDYQEGAFNTHEAERLISDIEKTLDYLATHETSDYDLSGTLSAACKRGQVRDIRCKHFYVTLYKKGTMHIKFRDQKLVDKFNIFCCRAKKWLPPNYGKAYDDLSADEQSVIDGFHGDGAPGSGCAKYAEVRAMADYYLASPGATPLLLAGKKEE